MNCWRLSWNYFECKKLMKVTLLGVGGGHTIVGFTSSSPPHSRKIYHQAREEKKGSLYNTESLFHGLLVAQTVQNLSATQKAPGVDLLVSKTPCSREQLHILIFLPGGFHGQRSSTDCKQWNIQIRSVTQSCPTL